ncbi:S9 family peptidase [Thermomicrobium sp. 4228-Ro]|uniref:S9 family peptidase n=1 Tax=Thermomicrobium sp. 4228-Ro TaxID=2993937 RepID=UPI002248B30A|nr:S9 family peptidase [Thermomicrobium sp. 4228-Ro]MCX2728431.1 S9 family peptidase [Thermomicrobium sp. 4228-Ro]
MLTVEELVTMRRPSDVRISPDGELVAYVVRPVSREGEHWESAIWVVPFAGGVPWQFTSGLWDDREPRWSPDGWQLAFLSDRAERGKFSVYVMPRDGGEAIRVCDQTGEISGLEWSPDGRFLSFLMVEPETDEERRRREQRDDAHVWESDWKFQRLWLLNPSTKEARVVTPERVQVWEYAWAPDGQRVALAVSWSPRVDDLYRETAVAVVDIESGDYRELFRLRGLAEDLVWSADGEWLAYRGPAGRVVHGEYVFRRRIEGGEPECLTPGYEGTVESLGSLAGGQALVVVAYEGVDARVYRLDWGGERALLCPRVTGSWHGAVSGSADGSRWAGVWSDGEHVPDVWAWRTPHDISLEVPEEAAGLQRLTNLHPEIERKLCPVRLIEWESDPGVVVQGLLVMPRDESDRERLPLVVQIHGGPTSLWANEFAASWHDWAQPLATRGCAVLLPNPRGSTGRGTAWINALFGDVGGGEYRDVVRGVESLVERGIADPARLGVAGWSWGGYLTAWTITQTDRFRAAFMGAGLCNLVSDNNLGDIPSANLSYFERTPSEDPDAYWERSPIRFVSRVTTPILIVHGEEDQRVSVCESIQFFRALQLLGKPCQLVTYPREKHGFEERQHQRDLLTRLLRWFAERLDFPAPERERQQSELAGATEPVGAGMQAESAPER